MPIRVALAVLGCILFILILKLIMNKLDMLLVRRVYRDQFADDTARAVHDLPAGSIRIRLHTSEPDAPEESER